MAYTAKELVLLILVGATVFTFLSFWLFKILKIRIQGKGVILSPEEHKKWVKSHLECPYRFDIERLLNLQKSYLKNLQDINIKKSKAIDRFIGQELALALNKVLDDRQQNYKYFRLVFAILKSRIMNILKSIVELNHFPLEKLKRDQFIEDKVSYIISDIKTYLLSLTDDKYFEETENFFESTMRHNLEVALKDIFNFIYRMNEDTDKIMKEEQTAYAKKALKILERKDEVEI